MTVRGKVSRYRPLLPLLAALTPVGARAEAMAFPTDVLVLVVSGYFIVPGLTIVAIIYTAYRAGKGAAPAFALPVSILFAVIEAVWLIYRPPTESMFLAYLSTYIGLVPMFVISRLRRSRR